MKNTHISSLTGLWNRCGAWVATHIRPLARPRLGPNMGSYREFQVIPKPHRGAMWVSWGKRSKMQPKFHLLGISKLLRAIPTPTKTQYPLWKTPPDSHSQ